MKGWNLHQRSEDYVWIWWIPPVFRKNFSYQTEHVGTCKLQRAILYNIFIDSVNKKWVSFRDLSVWSKCIFIETHIPTTIENELVFLQAVFCYKYAHYCVNGSSDSGDLISNPDDRQAPSVANRQLSEKLWSTTRIS